MSLKYSTIHKPTKQILNITIVRWFSRNYHQMLFFKLSYKAEIKALRNSWLEIHARFDGIFIYRMNAISHGNYAWKRIRYLFCRLIFQLTKYSIWDWLYERTNIVPNFWMHFERAIFFIFYCRNIIRIYR